MTDDKQFTYTPTPTHGLAMTATGRVIWLCACVSYWLDRGSRPISRAGKIPKIPFLGLSLLPNPTETLATRDMM